jgi:transposase-like protein
VRGGRITLDIPRDRARTFDPQLIARYRRRFPGVEDRIVSMYARGMSVREIRAHGPWQEMLCKLLEENERRLPRAPLP